MTVERHGVTGLYRGAGVRIIGAGFQQMFRWGGYTNISCGAGLGRGSRVRSVNVHDFLNCPP